jgi:hypothetical protein
MNTKRQHNTDNQEFNNNGDLGDLNTDENMAGTFHPNEDVEDENALEKLKAELEEQRTNTCACMLNSTILKGEVPRKGSNTPRWLKAKMSYLIVAGVG